MKNLFIGARRIISVAGLSLFLMIGCASQSPLPDSATSGVKEESLVGPKFKSSTSAIEIIPDRGATGATRGVPGLKGRQDVVTATDQSTYTGPGARPGASAPDISVSKSADGELVQFNFDNAELTEVIRSLADIMGIKYIEDPNIQGKVTIHTAEGVARKNLFPIFMRILEVNGVTAVKDGPVYRIAQIKDTTRLPIGVRLDSTTEPAEETEVVMTQVIPLRYAAPADMTKLIAPFLSPGGTIIAHDESKTLVIVDKGINIIKAMRLVKSFDIDLLGKTNYTFFFLQHADAEDAANVLQEMFSGSQPGQEVAKFIPIKRLNALLALSHNRTAFAQVEKLLVKIDAAGISSEPRIYVYFVKNGAAANLSSLLNSVFGTGENKQQPLTEARGSNLEQLYPGGTGGTTPASSLQSPSGLSSPQSPSSLSTSGRSGLSSSSGLGTSGSRSGGLGSGRAAGSPTNPLAVQRSTTRETRQPYSTTVPAGTSATLKGSVRITSDEIRNALIIEATPGDFRTIESILNRVDVMPRQVLIEATIAEISLDDRKNLGTDWSFVRRGTFGNGLQTLTIDGTTGLAAVIGFGDDLRARFNALMVQNKVNILSSPHVLASDNREARIDVSNEIPIASSQTVLTSTTPLVTTNVQYRDTGVMLSVTPHINERGLVTLDIYQEVSERAEDVLVAGVEYPSFFKRAVNTALTVKHGQSIVLGGLIRENKTNRKSGVPWFAELPVIGVLFGNHSKSFNKTELIILLSPKVIINLEDIDAVTDSFNKRVKNVTQNML